MKKILFPLITLLTLVSCGENAQTAHPAKAISWTVNKHPHRSNSSLADMLDKFQFDMTTIYGEAFTNKAWH